ncbi:S9 family peptidase [Paractinoplanes durhamensis]|uniref:Peptidase n=1 Tax=Paractinoplanes durhamensis TaxID=113563 RepID=A0ABQ3ZA65_9ACTN|nr:prolyl oligopeptidase family serine peptidase [Actinoplanes durhamensis]GIE06728.1 peptidase [Actinoplanes durhamensis]
MSPTYPQLLARTHGFRLGRPQRISLTPDGRRVLFLRSRGGEDPVRRLWQLDLETGAERLLADPLAAGAAETAPTAQEQVRRERARDKGSGIVDYSFDLDVRVVAYTVAQELHRVDPWTGEGARIPARTPLTDAVLSPDGTAVAYVHAGALRLIGADGTGDRALAEPESPDVTYGLAEHVAAESMDRSRGHWWSPDSDRLAVCRVDNAPVGTWYLSDPTHPETPPVAHRYPAAGTANAVVSLHILDRDGGRVDVDLGWVGYEYLVAVGWDAHGLLAVLQNRPQTVMRTVAVDPGTGQVRTVAESRDAAWTQIVPGVPARTASGALIGTADLGDTRHLTVDGEPVTPAGLQVAEVHGCDGDTVLFGASEEPAERHLWTWNPDDGVERVTTVPGRHAGIRAAGTTVVNSATPDGHAVTVAGRTVKDLSAASPTVPTVSLRKSGERALRTAVLFPAGWQGERLPVLMDPYGGPAAQRAVADRDAYYVSQWFADQGFAVIVADGRGTPGRGPRWERAIRGDRSTLLLEDQVDALHAVAAEHDELDLTRVGIRGWSAGGYLAALAVLRRPDVFHAAVAGAPVTDHLLYDTHWQERFLGDPRRDPDAYRKSSLIDDAAGLERPLMLIHGLRDDNVYPVHTMRLSAALLAAGRPHTVLPLPGAGHMGPDVDLLTPQLRFLRQSLNIN